MSWPAPVWGIQRLTEPLPKPLEDGIMYQKEPDMDSGEILHISVRYITIRDNWNKHLRITVVVLLHSYCAPFVRRLATGYDIGLGRNVVSIKNIFECVVRRGISWYLPLFALSVTWSHDSEQEKQTCWDVSPVNVPAVRFVPFVPSVNSRNINDSVGEIKYVSFESGSTVVDMGVIEVVVCCHRDVHEDNEYVAGLVRPMHRW